MKPWRRSGLQGSPCHHRHGDARGGGLAPNRAKPPWGGGSCGVGWCMEAAQAADAASSCARAGTHGVPPAYECRYVRWTGDPLKVYRFAHQPRATFWLELRTVQSGLKVTYVYKRGGDQSCRFILDNWLRWLAFLDVLALEPWHLCKASGPRSAHGAQGAPVLREHAATPFGVVGALLREASARRHGNPEAGPAAATCLHELLAALAPGAW